MYIKKLIISIVLILLSINNSFSQNQDYSKVKIDLSENGILKISSLGIPVDHGELKPMQYLITDLSKDEIGILIQHKIKHTIVIEDVREYYRSRNNETKKLSANEQLMASVSCGNSAPDYAVPNGFSLGSMGGFFTYAEFLAHVDTMALLYPTLITTRQPIDTFSTVEGRPIYWLKISDNPDIDENEPEVLYTALHHAREPGSLSQLIFYMYYLLENYASDSSIANLINNTELYFIPMVNPDGYVYNETQDPNGGGMWRKNRRDNGDGTFGIDLNRNYGYNWGYDDNGSSPNTNSNTYRGTSAFSEIETQAVKFFTEEHNIRITLNYHTYGNLFIYPWGYDYSLFTPDSALFVEYAKIMIRYNNYTFGTGDQTVGYIVNGDSDDWMYGEQISKGKIFACTPEVGTASDGFWPPSTRIIPQGKENIWQNLSMARLAGKFGMAEELSPNYITSKVGYFPFSIQRLGLDSPSTFTVTITPLDTLITMIGTPKVFNSLSILEKLTDSLYYELDPAISLGQEFRFLINVDNGLFVNSDTINKVYGQLNSLFVDNGDNINNWNTSPWGVSNTVFYSPSGSITDSPSGDYSNNTTAIITLSNPLDLTSVMKAHLSFYGRWEIEPGYDYTQVSASSDGGSSWSPLCGNYTKPGSGYQDPGNPVYDGFQSNWVYETLDLNDYAGQSILIQFSLKSDNWTQEDGFYFDDLELKAINNDMAISISGVNASCSGSDGIAVSNVTGGVLPYTYVWNDPSTQTTDSATGLSIGWYHVTISDDLGYTLVDSVEIINVGAPSLSVLTSDIACYGNLDGAIDLTLSGGVLPYTFNWTSGDTTEDLNNIGAGTYSVTVSDNNGCDVITSTTLYQSEQILSSVSITDDTGSTGVGAINITVTGGANPITYSWDNGASTEDLGGLVAGNYTVTITDSLGCIHAETYIVNDYVTVAQVSSIENVSVYPNPNNGTFTIDLKSNLHKFKVEVRNLLGQSVFFMENTTPQETINLNLSKFGPGILYLRLETLNQQPQIIIKKIVIY